MRLFFRCRHFLQRFLRLNHQELPVIHLFLFLLCIFGGHGLTGEGVEVPLFVEHRGHIGRLRAHRHFQVGGCVDRLNREPFLLTLPAHADNFRFAFELELVGLEVQVAGGQLLIWIRWGLRFAAVFRVYFAQFLEELAAFSQFVGDVRVEGRRDRRPFGMLAV